MTNQTPPPNDMNKALFVHLLTMLSMSAMQELGKLKNQLTGKVEVHLDMAQATIDMLDMLEAKTNGNRDAEEEKVLKDTLTMLKMNFVETSNSEQSAASSKQSEQGRKTEPQKEEPQGEEPQQSEPQKPAEQAQDGEQKGKENTDQSNTQPPENRETKDPKYHKAYS